MSEKRKDFSSALDGYMNCLAECGIDTDDSGDHLEEKDADGNIITSEDDSNKSKKVFNFLKELRGEVMLRIAVLRKEMGALDQAMQMCNSVASDTFGDSIRANALCLKVLCLFFYIYYYYY